MGGLSKEKRLTLAICLSSTFLVIEVIGGIWSNSLAILTDASHLLTDIAGFAIALLATIVAKRAADEKYTYGLVRAEVIGALLSVLTLWIITAVLLYEAYYRAMDWFNGSPSIVNGKLMSAVAIFGIFVNICLAVVFHEDHGGAFHSHDHGHAEGHGHDHGHSSSSGHEEKTITKGGYGSLDSAERGHAHDSDHEHGCHDSHDDHDHDHAHRHDHDHAHGHGHDEHDYLLRGDNKEASPTRDVNMEAAYLHVLTDLIQSVGVAIAGFIVWWRPDWEIADPVCTLLFSILVLYSTVGLIGRVIAILFEGVPAHVDWYKVRSTLEQIEGVTDIHDLHIWSISSSSVSLTCHMIAKRPQEALKKAILAMKSFGIDHVTIHAQEDTEPCISCSVVEAHN